MNTKFAKWELDLTETTKFLDLSNEQFYGNDHSRFRWKKIISNEKISNNLKLNNLIDKSEDSFDLNIIQRGKSGRVVKLVV